MSISSSLNAGVMGLAVNATRLATISDNIANSATNGYKRSEVDFSSMVLRQQQNRYSAGGVRANIFKNVDATGSLISTGNSTDLSVSGRGLLPVTNIAGIDQSAAVRSLMLTPTGSFSTDENGFLRTQSGLALLGWPAESDGTFVDVSRDSGAGLVPVNVNINQFTASRTEAMNLGVNLPADATEAGAAGTPYTLPTEYFDNLGRSQTLTMTFTPTVPATGASDQWQVEVFDTANPAGTAIASFGLAFDSSPLNGGSISAITPGAGMTYDALTGEVALGVAGGPMSLFVGRLNDNAGITQLAAPFSPHNVTKDGSPIGDLSSIEIDQSGNLEAVYDTGFRRIIYKIPVADVPNLNGLTAEDNQAYSVSPSSGGVYFWDAGTGPVGETAGYALMQSTTDIASELTDLIETQRAYTSNAKIIQTVDEMLQETTNIKR
ncbi:MAG: flagellar hook-basal body complex protein [Parvularculaceae bacterium]